MPNYTFVKGTIRPLTAFGTPPKGDTLFGQICWGVVHRHGEERLTSLLRGYTSGDPYLVVSDAFPQGCIPRPTLPHRLLQCSPGKEDNRKSLKRKLWLRQEDLAHPVDSWGSRLLGADDLPGGGTKRTLQHHNTLNRMSGTTGTGMFAPYTLPQLWFRQKNKDPHTLSEPAPVHLDLYFVCDTERLAIEELSQIVADMGATGFGRDASSGLGKFEILSLAPCPPLSQKNPNAFMALAPSLPPKDLINTQHSFYLPFTRFGRHGDAAVLRGKPFKTPVLLADTGAVFTLHAPSERLFIGQGLGGDGTLSKALPATAHQGFAPVVSLALETTPPRENR